MDDSAVHPLRVLLEQRQNGILAGIPSACTANPMVLSSCLEEAADTASPICIEATANQVNLAGGYSGLRPADFAALVRGLAERAGVSMQAVVLGGDHLGPLVWRSEPSGPAMAHAAELVRAYVLAGFTKIHIDTSMRLGDDSAVALPVETIAERAAILALEAENAFRILKENRPDAIHPIYVVGSEVPTPGGSLTEDDRVEVTSAQDAVESLDAFRNAFRKMGIDRVWSHVGAMVVQPGVEFTGEHVHGYSREAARGLVAVLEDRPGLVFEGHSTDYQTRDGLCRMVEDGIAILKVGPALTYALREGLFALSAIESELSHRIPEPSRFQEALEHRMLQDPSHWRGHYHGCESDLRLQRRFSFFDRSRYYLPDAGVQSAIQRLLANLEGTGIPPTLLSQYLPVQSRRVREGRLAADAKELLKDRVREVLEDYRTATRPRRRGES